MNGIRLMPFVQSGISMDYMDYSRNSFAQKKVYLSRRPAGRDTERPVSFSSNEVSFSSDNNKVSFFSDEFLPEKNTAKNNAAVSFSSETRHSLNTASGKSQLSEKKINGNTSADGASRNSFSASGRSGRSRRRKAFLLRSVLLAVILAGMTAGFQIMTRASSRPEQQTWKYYTTVTIPYGEDFHAIVYTYRDRTAYPEENDYIREICDINGLPYREGEVPDLSPGTKIVIPYYSTEKK